MRRSGFLIVPLLLSFLLGVFGNPIEKAVSLRIDDVIFQLFTRNDKDSGKRLMLGNNTILAETAFDPRNPTKIIVHDLMSKSIQLLKNAFLELEPMNVIGVDWSECGKAVMYDQSAACAKQLGGYMGLFITWLRDSAGLDVKSVHALGHSLGAEAVSFISDSHQISRITGLDPASPLFQHEDAKNRIDPSDADFVDVIHTSLNFYGMKQAVGQADFYVNGGTNQPGCDEGFIGGCSHSSSYHYFAHTVSQDTRFDYQGIKCDTVEDARNQTCSGSPQFVMGYGASKEYQGIYSVHTDFVP